MSDVDSRVATRTYSRTGFKKTTCVHTWTIEDFSLRPEKAGNCIESPRFSPAGDTGSTWSMELYPNGETGHDGRQYVGLFLTSHANSVSRAQYQFWIANSSGSKVDSMATEFKDFIPNEGWGCKRFVERAVLLDASRELLPGDVLTLGCEVTTYDSFSSSEPSAVHGPTEGSRLQDDFKQLFISKDFADAVISVEGKTFEVHKNVLSARSSVFRAMFRAEMTESDANQVEIDDFTPEVIHEMLTFIYTESAPNLRTVAGELLRAADKYDLKLLKRMSGEVLMSSISIETAADVCILGEMFDVTNLKTRAIDFINGHAADVIQTDGWKKMVREKPDLVVPIYCRLFG